MSAYYAPSPDGRMRKNFGPIDNAGGEKRLNVTLSHVRQHFHRPDSVLDRLVESMRAI